MQYKNVMMRGGKWGRGWEKVGGKDGGGRMDKASVCQGGIDR